MRSAVSSILSEMSEPTPLSFPDYAQVSSDHSRLLVLVKSVSPSHVLKPKSFAKVVEVLDRGGRIQVNSAEDVTRSIEVRFVRSYAPESNEWGEFQQHRAVLGLVSVGAYKNKKDHQELGRLHETVKQKYSKHLLCSRLIALKERPDPSSRSANHENSNGDENNIEEEDDDEEEEENSTPHYNTSPHGKLEYGHSLENEKALEQDISTFLTTMFWLLEKARVEKQALDASGKVPLLCAPFERRDFVGLDLESRANKRRTSGRFKKHMGDLSLMCGLVREAYAYYEQAAEILKSCNDWLWLANSLEGICSIATLVHFPNIKRTNMLRRNSSFQAVNSGQLAPLRGSRKERRGVEDDEAFKKRVISTRELIDNLREIVVHYSKYRNAGVVETETSIKSVHILIEQGNILFAAEFLQNIVFINLSMNDEEKVHRFSALSRLYSRIGFHRKAAFFHRVAAMRCVAPQNPHTDWAMCYQLLLKTLSGYNINFQAVPLLKAPTVNAGNVSNGWSSLQIQIMQELVGTSRRMGDHVAATRHMAFIVQNLFHSLSVTEKSDLCAQLGVLTSKSPGTPVPHTVEAGVILPPVNIYTVPKVVQFKPCELSEPLLAPSPSLKSSDDGPFIFTPIQADKGKSKPVNWVQGEVASVEISVINPLPVELKISSIVLLHEGADFDAFPSSFVLEPGVTQTNNGFSAPVPQALKLSGIPKEPGALKILGYSCIVFGVKSHCRLKNLSLSGEDSEERSCYEITVCPSIPRLEMSIAGQEELPKGEPLMLSIYHGEEVNFDLSFLNASSLTVEKLELVLQTVPARFRPFVSFKGPKDDSEKRIKPGDKLTVPVTVKGPDTKCRYVPCDDDGLQQPQAIPSLSSKSSTQDSFAFTLATKYTSDEETSRGYCRQLTQRASVSFQQSLVVTWWDVLPGETADECYVILDVCNLTDLEAELEYASGKHIVIDANGTCRIPLPVAKVQVGGEEDEESDEERRRRFLAAYLDEKVALRWAFTQEQRRGRVSLAGIELDQRMTSRLEMSSVSWSVTLNGEKWQGSEYALRTGEPILLEIALNNHYNLPVSCCFAVKSCYVTDSGDSSPVNSVPVPFSGGRTYRRCQPSKQVVHKSNLIPFAPGKLCLTCSCRVFGEADEADTIDQILIPNIYVNVG